MKDEKSPTYLYNFIYKKHTKKNTFLTKNSIQYRKLVKLRSQYLRLFTNKAFNIRIIELSNWLNLVYIKIQNKNTCESVAKNNTTDSQINN